jgi:hypothetical protein
LSVLKLFYLMHFRCLIPFIFVFPTRLFIHFTKCLFMRFFLSVYSYDFLNVYSANLFPFIQRIYFRLFSEFISVYSANLFPFIQRIYFRFFAAFFAVLTQWRVPYGNAVRTCTHMFVHVENAVL